MATDQTSKAAGDATMEAILAEFGDSAFRPGPLSPDGAGQGTINNGMGLELMSLMGRLKARRAMLGLSVATVSRRSELTEEAIEGLESGRVRNPHFDAVWRYAIAMDVLPTIVLEEVEPGPEQLEDREGE